MFTYKPKNYVHATLIVDSVEEAKSEIEASQRSQDYILRKEADH